MEVKKILIDGKSHLCLFTIKDINLGEGKTYNYGGTDWPWREKVCHGSISDPYINDLSRLNQSFVCVSIDEVKNTEEWKIAFCGTDLGVSTIL